MSTMVNGNKTFLALWVALGLRLILWIFIIALVIALVTMVWVRAISRRKIAYPVGLEVLSEAEDIEIDIIAVHNLGVHPIYTWTMKTPRSHESINRATVHRVHWLRDLLPCDILGARIASFGYESEPFMLDGPAALKMTAKRLLRHLRDLRSSLKEPRPILFIGHGFGGIIIKEALNQSNIIENFKDIRESTSGVIFLGTPHQGSRVLLSGHLVMSILGPIFFPNLLKMYKILLQSESLIDLSDTFLATIPKDVSLYSFSESVPTYVFGRISVGLIVDRISSYAGFGVHYLMDTDHSGLNKYGSRDDGSYRRVVHSIQDIIKASKIGRHTRRGWCVPIHRNEKFVGREPQIAQIKDAFLKQNSTHFSLMGSRGVGKTEIAIELVYRISQEHPDISVYWVSATNKLTVDEAYTNISRQLKGYGTEWDKADSTKLVRDRLSQDSCGQWLMIFDNVWPIDSVFSSSGVSHHCLSDYLPRSSKGCIIFTTRDKKTADYFSASNFILVDMLDEESSLDLLRMSLKSSSVLDDRENSQRLLRLLNFHPLAITKASDYINGNEGTTILDYISILRGSQELVLQLTETRRIVLGEDHPDTLGSMTHLSSIYRSQGELDLAEALDLQVMERREKINGNMHPDTLESMENLALTYRHQGRCKEAEDLDNQVLERRNALGEGHMERVPLSRSQSLSHQEQTKEIDMHEGDAVVLLKDKFLDSVTNNNSSSITQSAKDGGRNTRAELLELQTIDMRTAFLGNENPETLNSMSDLAARYRSQGRWREAEELLLQVTEKRTKVLSLEHPDTLSSMYSLALTFWSQGLLEKAEELILRVVEARKRVLGKGHPDTLATINSLALTYWSRGLWEMAEEMVIQVLETMKEVLKAEHPQTMRSMANLAQIRWCLGKKREAIDQMAECLRLRRQILGIEHPASRAARRSLITWQRSLPTAISSSARNIETLDSVSTDVDGSATEGYFLDCDTITTSNKNEDHVRSDTWVEHMEKVLSNLQRTGINDRVKIAILDSGIDAEKKSIGKTVRYIFKHSLLRQKFNNSLKGYYDFSDAKEPEEMRDQYGHGTHTTGLLLKVAPRAEIFVAQVGKGTQNSAKSIKFAPDVDMVAKAIEYATDEWHVDMITMSFGFSRQHKTLERAITHAKKNDVIMFAAASNDGLNTLGAFPALYEEVIPVFSANAFGAFSEFNPGQFDRYSFCALGENVKSFWPELPPQDSEYAKYKRLSGTSIATPIVAGIAANLLDFVKRRDSESQDSERLWETVRFRQSGVARAMKVLAREHPDKRKLFYFKFKDLLGKESEGVGDFIWKEIAREFLDY